MRVSLALAALLAAGWPARAAPPQPASAPAAGVDGLADDLAECAPAAAGAPVQPDGTAPAVACTRQWVRGRTVRRDIAMTFGLGSATLTAPARARLDAFAEGLRRVGSFRPFAVEGHTDASGGRALNMALSRARAQAVVDHLAARGIDRSRMSARGFGPDRPLPGRGANDPANRRVEVSAS